MFQRFQTQVALCYYCFSHGYRATMLLSSRQLSVDTILFYFRQLAISPSQPIKNEPHTIPVESQMALKVEGVIRHGQNPGKFRKVQSITLVVSIASEEKKESTGLKVRPLCLFIFLLVILSLPLMLIYLLRITLVLLSIIFSPPFLSSFYSPFSFPSFFLPPPPSYLFFTSSYFSSFLFWSLLPPSSKPSPLHLVISSFSFFCLVSFLVPFCLSLKFMFLSTYETKYFPRIFFVVIGTHFHICYFF